jgi:diguanylate cyclase (GGDEF)-like protein
MLQRLEENTDQHFHLLLADVDFFKRVNDDYGHDVGDYVLKELADLIQSSLPNNGFASRWGGEEFLIAVGDCSESDIYSLAEKIRIRVETHNFTYEDHTFSMTLSIGVAATNQFTPLREAITLADNRLYYAKRAGRNQTRRS